MNDPLPAMGRTLAAAFVLAMCVACGSDVDTDRSGSTVELEVPRGAPFTTVVDTLQARGLVESPFFFRLYSRIRGADREVRAGHYAFPRDAGWNRILSDLTAGRVLTVALTIPEGFTFRRAAPRIAEVAESDSTAVVERMREMEAGELLDTPGSVLEGYLFPDTYRFALGTPVDEIVETMVDHYHSFWTPPRRARLDSLEMSEHELVTLASVVQAEARRVPEMDTIASVYHNRLRRSMLLEADPTVLYALGGHRERLLFAAMDSVAEHPYNTYTQPGLPPGPIGAPGAAALDATLWPADTDYYYFVARGDGSHIFSRTLSEHNRAVRQVRQAQGR